MAEPGSMTVACQNACSLQTLEEASGGLSRFEYDLQMRTQGRLEFHVGLVLQNKESLSAEGSPNVAIPTRPMCETTATGWVTWVR